MSFHSSFTKVAPIVKQTLYFCGGDSKTIENIITSKIKQLEYTELTCTNGVIWSINPKKVNYFTTVSEGDKPLGDTQETKLKKIYHFVDGSKLCLDNISGIKQGEFIKVHCTDGVIWSINPENVNCFETITNTAEIKVRDTMAEAQWDATLTGNGYYKKDDSFKYCQDYIDKLYARIANKEVKDVEEVSKRNVEEDDKPFFQDFLDKHPEVKYFKTGCRGIMPLFVGDFIFPNKEHVEIWKIENSDLYEVTIYNHDLIPKTVTIKSEQTQQQVLDILEETLGEKTEVSEKSEIEDEDKPFWHDFTGDNNITVGCIKDINTKEILFQEFLFQNGNKAKLTNISNGGDIYRLESEDLIETGNSNYILDIIKELNNPKK